MHTNNRTPRRATRFAMLSSRASATLGLILGLFIGLLIGLSPALHAQLPDERDAQNPPPPVEQTDRDFVLAAGLPEAEADCCATTARAAGEYFALPEMHPMDKQEVASAIHIVQNKLLSRPTYRTYLASAKAAAETR